MKTSIRTIMNARAKQRKTSVMVRGFKCHEVGHKRYLNMKQSLRTITSTIEKLENEETPRDSLIDRWYKHKEELKKAIAEYEKKNNIHVGSKKDKWVNVKEHPELDPTKRHGLMDKVRSLFSRRKI